MTGRPRVVSLVPSITETLRAWGVDPVACTRFCEQPDLPTVGGTKDPEVGAIAALHPDLVVVDREENRREDAEALNANGCEVHVTHVTSVDDVAPALADLAGRIGVNWSPPAAAGTTALTRLAFVPIWRRPWMSVNAATYGSSLLAACGIGNVFADHPDRYPTVTLDEAAARSPDLAILPSEPYPFADRHVAEMRGVAPDVVLVDGRDLFWWGVRTPGAIERLTAQLQVVSG